MANYWTSSLQNGVPVGSPMACQSCNQVFMDSEAFEAHIVQAVLMTSSGRQYPSSPVSTPTMAAPLQENMITASNGRTFHTLPHPTMVSPPARMGRNFPASPLSFPPLRRPIQHAPPSIPSMEVNDFEVTSPLMDASKIDDGTDTIEPYISPLKKPIK